MSYSSAHWLVRVLHRILLSANSFARRSIQRWLYVWAILTRQSRRQRPSNDERPFPSSNVETIHYELSGIDDSCGSIPVYPSAQPRPRSPSSNTQGTPGLPGLTTSPAFILQAHLHGRHSASQSMHELGATSQTRYSPDNSSVSSRQSAISLAPPSITRRGRNQGRSSLLRPYSYGGRSASRSLQDLETVSRHNYSLNNFSTASRHRSHSSRAPSPVASSTRSSDTGSYHISIDPGSPLSEYSAASQDDFPNVAIPAGDVALPESGEASVLTGKLYQTTPEWILRYERGVYIPMTESQYRIQPLQTIFPHSEPLPSEWTTLTHPEGALYFYHQNRKIFTDAHLYNPDILLHATAFIRRIDDLKRIKNVQLDAELVLEITPDDQGMLQCGYYFVDHQTRSLFWLEEFEAEDLTYEIKGLSSAAHLKHEIESQYCCGSTDTISSRKHWELFPNTYMLSQDIIDELSDILLYASGDCLTSSVSTAPYNLDDLNKMLHLVSQVKPGRRHGHSTCYVGRLMYTFAHQKFLHFHGQNGARLCRDQSLYNTGPSKRSLLITILSPILFNAPDVHLRALGDIWVDDIIGHVPWTDFMTKLTNDWKEFTLYATVLLNANVAFLAIQSIDTNHPNRSGAQISSYGSIIVSVGSIILGLLLERQNRTKDRESAEAASSFLARMSHPSLGLETLAIMYSLPYALLMWGMLSFLSAFCFMCFANSSIHTRSIVGAVSLAICMLIIWSIWAAWESGEHYLLAWLKRIYESSKTVVQVKNGPEKSTRQWHLPFVRRSLDSTPASEKTVQV